VPHHSLCRSAALPAGQDASVSPFSSSRCSAPPFSLPQRCSAPKLTLIAAATTVENFSSLKPTNMIRKKANMLLIALLATILSIPKYLTYDFFEKYFKILEKIKYIIKSYYIINYTLFKIINNFDFLLR
jgi:hypothetical protein